MPIKKCSICGKQISEEELKKSFSHVGFIKVDKESPLCLQCIEENEIEMQRTKEEEMRIRNEEKNEGKKGEFRSLLEQILEFEEVDEVNEEEFRYLIEQILEIKEVDEINDKKFRCLLEQILKQIRKIEKANKISDKEFSNLLENILKLEEVDFEEELKGVDRVYDKEGVLY